MTWLELKEQIRDLGFEEDSTMNDYNSIVINASNRAVNFILKTIVEKYQGYFQLKLSTDTKTWKVPSISKITSSTDDAAQINLPDKVIDLVPLLAAHYVWLDDDIQKSTQYWNEYDDLKNQLIEDMQRPVKCVFGEGLWW